MLLTTTAALLAKIRRGSEPFGKATKRRGKRLNVRTGDALVWCKVEAHGLRSPAQQQRKKSMRKNIAAAVFEDRDHAEKAIHELRDAGVPDSAISVIEMHSDKDDDRDSDRDRHRTTGADEGDNKASGTTKGLIAGGSLGAIAGLGALLIPGVGPFIAAGALAEALGAAGSAAVVSGAVGAAAGGLTGALIDYGFDREHAEYYEKRIREGGVLVAVDTSDNPSAFGPARGILRAAGGESAETRDEADART